MRLLEKESLVYLKVYGYEISDEPFIKLKIMLLIQGT